MQWWHIALLIALLIAVISPVASTFPDGLESVAEEAGFMESAQGAHFQLIPDYSVPGVENTAVATILAGIIGTLLVFIIGFGLASLLKPKNEA